MTATLEPTTTASGAKAATGASPADVVRKAKEAGVQVVDLRFTDLPGTWQHFSIPLKELTEELFAEGIGFDGSSIRGFQAINESDMLLFPDPASAFVDPCLEVPTLSLTCDVSDPVTGQRYSRDPRYVAQKAEQYLVKSGIATTAYYGPEAEFYIFNSVRFDQNAHEGYYHIDSEEGIWNSGTNGSPNMGHRPRHKEGYFGAAGGPAAGPALEDHAGADRVGGRRRGTPPRGGHGGADRDRHAVHDAGTHGRPADDVQVHREERVSPARLHGDVHAQADVRRQRVGDARAHESLEGRHEPVLRPQGVRAPV